MIVLPISLKTNTLSNKECESKSILLSHCPQSLLPQYKKVCNSNIAPDRFPDPLPSRPGPHAKSAAQEEQDEVAAARAALLGASSDDDEAAAEDSNSAALFAPVRKTAKAPPKAPVKQEEEPPRNPFGIVKPGERWRGSQWRLPFIRINLKHPTLPLFRLIEN